MHKELSLVHGCTQIWGCYKYFINDVGVTSRPDGDDIYKSSNVLVIGWNREDPFCFCLRFVTFLSLGTLSSDGYAWGIDYYINMLGY